MVPIMNLIGGNHYYYMRGMNINPKILNNNSHIVSQKKTKKKKKKLPYCSYTGHDCLEAPTLAFMLIIQKSLASIGEIHRL